MNKKPEDNNDGPSLLLRVREAARLTGMSVGFAYQLARSGEWPTVRVGRALRVHRAALEEWATRNVTGGGKAA